jgi:hypothetical protein
VNANIKKYGLNELRKLIEKVWYPNRVCSGTGGGFYIYVSLKEVFML